MSIIEPLHQELQRFPFTYGLTGFLCLCFIIQSLLPEMILVYSLDFSTMSISQVYQFLTYFIVHQNIAHLVVNGGALVLFGRIIEERTGAGVLAGTTLLGVLLPALTILVLTPLIDLRPSLIAGASGITFTMIGMTCVIAPLAHFSSPETTGMTEYLRGHSLIRIVDIAGIWALAAVIPQLIRLLAARSVPVVGHLTGFVVGILIGLVLMTRYPDDSLRTLIAEREGWFRTARV